MAKSFGQVFEKITTPENLEAALKRAAKGKRDRPAVQEFLRNAENELAMLKYELESGTYQPSRCTQFKIMDPKPRIITCAAFRDRVVHHALCGLVGPLMERRFIFDSYACRVGKGSHRAVLRAQQLLRKNKYVLKADIRKYYDHIDHAVLLEMLRRTFREPQLNHLFTTIITHPFPNVGPSAGLPIGNLTSQWFANFYLDRMDHYVQEELKPAGYIRYMDDFILLADSKETLWKMLSEVHLWLLQELKLALKFPVCCIFPATEGLPFLGYTIFPGVLRLQGKRLRRSRRLLALREEEYLEGGISAGKLVECVGALAGLSGTFGMKNLFKGGISM